MNPASTMLWPGEMGARRETFVWISERLRYLGIRATTTLRARRHGWPKAEGARVWMLHGVVEHFMDRALEHNFTTLADFRDCVSVFRRRRPVGLEELARFVHSDEGTPPDGVLITFDDGYRNNLLACEVLAKAGLKAAIFVCPGIPDGRTVWPAEVSLLVLQGGRNRLDILGRQWDLSDPMARRDACRRIRAEMKRLPAGERVRVLEELEAQFPQGFVEECLSRYPSLQLLSREEIRQLAQAGIAIGSHGMSHEIQHEQQSDEVLSHEIVKSKSAIEKLTGRECLAFAYPNGDYVAESRSLLKAAGYRLGLTTHRGCLTPQVDPYLLPRMEGSRVEAAVRDAYYLAEKI